MTKINLLVHAAAQNRQTLLRACEYLQKQGEKLEPGGLGMIRVNGELQRPDEVVAYYKSLLEEGR